ncbi:MAG: UDP-glucose dehydrogenase family protein, partial [Nitrosopumilaceae archaeon]
MNLGVIGAGYVGLTTAVCLASIGHKMNVYDVNKIKIQKLKNKKIPFYEPGLQELFEKVISTDNLKISESLDDLTQNTDGSFICVGTPSHETKSIDLSQVIDATNSLAESIKKNKKNNYVVIVRSTILPQTTRNTILPILKSILSEGKFGLCVMPEFLREGEAISDFMNPDKIVIGHLNEESKEFAEMIFEHFRKSSHFITTNFETAEMIKYANNAFFSTLISFSNEIANVSERIRGIDAFQVMAALVSDKRITMTVNDKKVIPYLATYLLPGCGFGGSCFPKDVKALIQHALSINTNTPLLNAVLKINEERPQRIISLAELLLGSLKGKQISILGLAFKPDTDDIRSSPAIE